MVSVQHESNGRKRDPSTAGRCLVDRRSVLAAGLACLANAGRAWAEVAFPSRPLTIMAPANPGGGTDQIARLMQSAIALGKLSPRPMEVINRGGAAGAIGLADLVSRHYGDPHIIMASGSSVISSTVTQNTALRLTDAEPLARLIVDHLIVATPTVIAVCEHPRVARCVPEGSGRHHLVRRFRRRRRPYAGRADRRGVRHPDATTCATSRTREGAPRLPPFSADK